MNSNKMLRNYVSEIDQLLQNFDKEHPKLSASQKKEITEYERIYRLRDKSDTVSKPTHDLWENF